MGIKLVLYIIIPVIDITKQSDINGFGVKLRKLMIDHYENGFTGTMKVT